MITGCPLQLSRRPATALPAPLPPSVNFDTAAVTYSSSQDRGIIHACYLLAPRAVNLVWQRWKLLSKVVDISKIRKNRVKKVNTIALKQH